MSTTINVHNVQKVSLSPIKYLGVFGEIQSYFRTLTFYDDHGKLIELTVVSYQADKLNLVPTGE